MVFLAGCAPTPAPATAAPLASSTAPIASVAMPTPEPAPDLSPVPAPQGLSFTLRLSRPKVTADQVAALVAATPLQALVGGPVELGELITNAVGAPVQSLLDLDRPMDFAMSDADAGQPRMAGAAILVDPVAARDVLSRYYTLQTTAPGVVRLLPRDDAPEGATPRPCMMALSPASTTRLVCGVDKTSLLHLGPYLARTMPTVASSADVRLEVFTQGLQLPRAGETRVLTPGGPRPTDAGPPPDPTDELMNQLFDQANHDLSSFVVEASSDGATLDLRVGSTFSAATSPLTRALVGLGLPDAQVPSALGVMPADASFAWYSRGAASADLAPLKQALLGSLRESLAQDGYTASQLDALMAPFQQMLMTGGPWACAGGTKLDAARAALDAYAAGHVTSASARIKARTPLQGWLLAEVDEPAQPWVDTMRTVVKLGATKPGGKPLRKQKPSEEDTDLVLAAVPAGLPAGSLHVEIRETPNPAWSKAQPRHPPPVPGLPRTRHLLIVPDGSRTWFALAGDVALAAAQVRVALDPAAAHLSMQTLTSALGVDARTSGGFLSLANFAVWAADDVSDEDLRKTRDTLTSLATLPAGGLAPVPMTVVARPNPAGASAGGDVSLRVQVPIDLVLRAASANPPIF